MYSWLVYDLFHGSFYKYCSLTRFRIIDYKHCTGVCVKQFVRFSHTPVERVDVGVNVVVHVIKFTTFGFLANHAGRNELSAL